MKYYNLKDLSDPESSSVMKTVATLHLEPVFTGKGENECQH